MIKTFLKHWVYERCLDVLFDYIKSNFIGYDIRKFKSGMYFKLLEHVPPNWECVVIYHDGIITRISEPYIYFKYTWREVIGNSNKDRTVYDNGVSGIIISDITRFER